MTDRFFTNALSLGGALAGTEQFPYDIPAGGSAFATPQQIATYVAVALAAGRTATDQYHADSSTSGFTASASEVALPSGASTTIGIIVLDLTGTLGAPANVQLPTASAVLGVLAAPFVGQTWILRILNNSSGAFAWTVTTNTGLTLNGTMSINQSTFRDFLLEVTNVGTPAIAVQNVGSGGN